MGKSTGGGGGQQQQQPQPTTQNVNQSNLPEYVRPYFERLLSRAESTSQNQYTPYEGQRIAPLTTPQQEGMALARENVGVAQPYLQQAGTAITGAAGQAAGTYGYQAPGITSQYQAGSYTPTAGIMQPTQMWNPEVAQQYMSPYQQQVIDIGKREATRQAGITSLQDQTRATQAGGYGGYRQGIVESEAQRNLQQRMADIQAQGNQAGYQQAGQMFGADRAAQLAGAQAAQQASQFGYGATESARQAQGQQSMAAQQAQAGAQAQAAQIGLGAGQLGIQAGQGLGALGTTTQKAGAADVTSLMGMGEVQRQANQQGLNLAYQDFLAQQYYPQQQEQYLSSVLRGSVINPSTMSTTYQAPYDPVSQALSMGLGGIGLMKAFS